MIYFSFNCLLIIICVFKVKTKFGRKRMQSVGMIILIIHPLCTIKLISKKISKFNYEEWGEWMREKLILDTPHRQVVFTIPKMLRIFFKFNRSLLSALCVCGKEALIKYLKAATKKDINPGIIAVIQSFGSRINFHPHLHFLVTEGGGQIKKDSSTGSLISRIPCSVGFSHLKSSRFSLKRS